MTFAAAIGVLVITGVLIYATLGYLGSLYMQHGFAGFGVLDWADWVIIIILGLIIVAAWVGWWYLIGDAIHIGVSYGK